MFEDLTFGWRPAVLTVAAAVIAPIVIALLNAINNRRAAQTMAMLLIALVGIFSPWLIGFAGAYDKRPGLTFLPVAMPLFVPPLFYLYAHALTRGAWPNQSWIHLAPGGVEFLWQAVSFCLPLELKSAWATAILPVALPFFTLALTVSFVGYGWATNRMLKEYRAALAHQRSDDPRFALRWLDQVMAAAVVLAVFWTIYGAWDVVAPIGFNGLMGLYLGVAGIAVFLAIEAWRQTRALYPTLSTTVGHVIPPPIRDWSAQAKTWSDRVRSEGWTSEPDLTLAVLAARLGTNTSYLSKAINEGLGVNFSTFVNDLRSEVVATQIDEGSSLSLLTLALDAGFSSKASFNRAFRRRFDQTPKAYRDHAMRRRS